MLIPDIAYDHGSIILTFAALPDAFASATEAERYLKDRGFSVGRPQAGEPRGVLFGEFLIAKWRNLDAADRLSLDGTITGDGRHGPTTVTIFDYADPAALRAIRSTPGPKPRSRAARVLDTAWDCGVVGLIVAFAYFGWIVTNPLPERPRVEAANPLTVAKIGLRAEALRLRGMGQ